MPDTSIRVIQPNVGGAVGVVKDCKIAVVSLGHVHKSSCPVARNRRKHSSHGEEFPVLPETDNGTGNWPRLPLVRSYRNVTALEKTAGCAGRKHLGSIRRNAVTRGRCVCAVDTQAHQGSLRRPEVDGSCDLRRGSIHQGNVGSVPRSIRELRNVGGRLWSSIQIRYRKRRYEEFSDFVDRSSQRYNRNGHCSSQCDITAKD